MDRNPIFIKKIRLKNYRTYDDLTISFTQNIHTLVGPNECGKTNLLLAFELFNSPNFLQESDTCCYVDEVFETVPEIEFVFSKNFLKSLNLDTNVDKLKIVFDGNNRKVEIPGLKPSKEIDYSISITGKLATGQIHITIPELVEGLGLSSDHHIEADKKYSFTTKSKDIVDKIKEYITKHQYKDQIILGITENSFDVPKTININDILKNIKVVNWTFKPEYYIPSVIPLSDLQSNPNKFRSIDNFFKIAKIKLKDFLSTTNQNRRNNILRRVNRQVSKILNQSWTQYQELELNLFLGTDSALHVGFLENEQTIDPSRRSLGFQWFFAFLLNFNANFGNELKNCIILLDEPGIYLHPGGQKDLLKEIEKLAIFNQILYTSHLPFMINRNHPERIIYLNKRQGISILKLPRKEGVFDDILLANTLGFSFSSISNFGEVNLFVEGITDKILIEDVAIKYSQKYNEDLLDLNYISIIPINGIENLDSFIRVAQEVNINFLVLLDHDETGLNKFKKYKNNTKKYNRADDFFFILDKDKEIEDLIPYDIFNKAFNDLKKDEELWNSLIPENRTLEEKNINKQIKEIINEIKTSISEKQNKSVFIDITPGQLKLDLILKVKEFTNEENLDSFKDLIKKLKEINNKGLEIIKEIN